ncbi:hypothetical protein DL771_011687 [Monosporascus sp. 5C6A]|nr:hypothetical protein DL771_011687 [Monosporascus sp. 5C6A]
MSLRTLLSEAWSGVVYHIGTILPPSDDNTHGAFFTCRTTLTDRLDNLTDDFAGLKGQVDVLTTGLEKGRSVDDAIEYHLRDFLGSDNFKGAVKTATKDASDISKTATAVLAALKDEILAFVKKQVSTAMAETTKTAKAATPGLSVSVAAPPAASPTPGATRIVSSPAAPSSVASSPAPFKPKRKRVSFEDAQSPGQGTKTTKEASPTQPAVPTAQEAGLQRLIGRRRARK